MRIHEEHFKLLFLTQTAPVPKKQFWELETKAEDLLKGHMVNSRGFISFARKLAILSVQQSNLNSTRYCRMLIPLPPKPEQEEIRDYLDSKTTELSRFAETINSQIETLLAYRKSHIHECVTGKRLITDADLKRVGVDV